ncbi:transposase [[Actinobacillus] muris]|uniref:Transposase n=1 Tax=Muribacter muris TaxID=67855 RepID=A0A0J5P6D6_9PAST|nr:transposase [[Actinobacillus] muris] [Muribacter muris]
MFTEKLLGFFALEVTSRSAANILGIQPNSAILFYHKIRQAISYHLSLKADDIFEGKIELDESYFGGYRKGKRGRRAARKVVVYGILKRQRKVFTIVVENTKSETVLPVIKRKIKTDSWAYTDNYRSYDALDVSEFHHERINHSEIFAERENHINGIENFWSQTKRSPRKYNGINQKNFPLLLKEYEFRFNVGIPKIQLRTLRKWREI